jgi:hypothetical protein
MAALSSRPGAGEAESALAAIRRLHEVTATHLDHEEDQLEQFYLQNEDNPAIKEMGKQFAKAGPKKAGPFMAWVDDGADAELKSALRSNVPGPVLAVMAGVFGRSYRKNVAPVWRS